MTRGERLLQSADKSSRIVEIGPGYAPVAAKAAGWNVHVVDHTSREGLRRKYTGAEVDLEAIEDVDSIWRDGPLHDAVPAPLHGSFDLLIASHLVEHIPDLIGFFESAERLLGKPGVISLAIPDKRFCFDHFQSPTMTGDLLEAHAARRSRHTARTAWNSLAYGVTLDGALAVGQLPVERIEFMVGWEAAVARWRQFTDAADQPYQDHHAWYFTPAGFSLVILELGQLGLVDWHIESLHGPEGFEFFAALRRGAERLADVETFQSRRMDLLKQLLEELRGQPPAPESQDAAPQAASEASPVPGQIAAPEISPDNAHASLGRKFLALARRTARSLGLP